MDLEAVARMRKLLLFPTFPTALQVHYQFLHLSRHQLTVTDHRSPMTRIAPQIKDTALVDQTVLPYNRFMIHMDHPTMVPVDMLFSRHNNLTILTDLLIMNTTEEDRLELQFNSLTILMDPQIMVTATVDQLVFQFSKVMILMDFRILDRLDSHTNQKIPMVHHLQHQLFHTVMRLSRTHRGIPLYHQLEAVMERQNQLDMRNMVRPNPHHFQ